MAVTPLALLAYVGVGVGTAGALPLPVGAVTMCDECGVPEAPADSDPPGEEVDIIFRALATQLGGNPLDD